VTDTPDETDNLIQLNRFNAEPVEPIEAPEDGRETPPPSLIEPAVEALLFSASDPVTVSQLNGWLGRPGAALVEDALLTLADRLKHRRSGVRLVEVSKGWQLRTDVRFARWVSNMRGQRPLKLSRAALDTLAVVAYMQPLTRRQIEDVRGVDPSGVLRSLAELGLVEVNGQTEPPNRAQLWGTTDTFLNLFGLRDLSELPTLADLRDIPEFEEAEDPGDLSSEALFGMPAVVVAEDPEPAETTFLDPAETTFFTPPSAPSPSRGGAEDSSPAE